MQVSGKALMLSLIKQPLLSQSPPLALARALVEAQGCSSQIIFDLLSRRKTVLALVQD